MTSEAPDRIWPQCDTKNHIAELAELGVKPVPEVKSSFVEYIRHDLHLAAVAEAYEAAIDLCENATPSPEWGDDTKSTYLFAGQDLARSIRKATPADALAAREARDKKIREEALRVKPLVWKEHPSDNRPALSKAVTSFGTYFIVDDMDDFSGVYLQFVSHDRAKWWQHVRSTCETIMENYHEDDLAPVKAAAQADYERRILSALIEGETDE